MRNFFCLPATTAGVERLFSTSGFIPSSRRLRVVDRTFHKLSLRIRTFTWLILMYESAKQVYRKISKMFLAAKSPVVQTKVHSSLKKIVQLIVQFGNKKFSSSFSSLWKTHNWPSLLWAIHIRAGLDCVRFRSNSSRTVQSNLFLYPPEFETFT